MIKFNWSHTKQNQKYNLKYIFYFYFCTVIAFLTPFPSSQHEVTAQLRTHTHFFDLIVNIKTNILQFYTDKAFQYKHKYRNRETLSLHTWTVFVSVILMVVCELLCFLCSEFNLRLILLNSDCLFLKVWIEKKKNIKLHFYKITKLHQK